MNGFAEEHLNDWSQLLELVRPWMNDWLFRGQPGDWPLRSSLDRALTAYGALPVDAPAVEKQLIKDFRRRYDGPAGDLGSLFPGLDGFAASFAQRLPLLLSLMRTGKSAT